MKLDFPGEEVGARPGHGLELKGAVKNRKRQDAYMNVWSAMHAARER